MFHVCEKGGKQDSFLCPNGTIFSQKVFACDWWYNVQCSATTKHYRLNRNLYKVPNLFSFVLFLNPSTEFKIQIQGSDVNLYGMPSFWNWLSDMEETFTQAPVRRPKGKSLQNAQKRPKVQHQQQQYADAGVSGISDPSKFFRWVDDASIPDDMDDMAPELSWANLKPDGPVMMDSNEQLEQPAVQQQQQSTVFRRSKPKQREQKLIKNTQSSHRYNVQQYYDIQEDEVTTYAPISKPVKK